MLTFRQKILVSYLVVFLAFIALLYPVVSGLIESVQERNLERRTEELISRIDTSDNVEEMVDRLKTQQTLLFFRITLLSDKGQVLYDSHRSVGDTAQAQEKMAQMPEIKEVMGGKNGHDVRYSPLFGQEMAYLALPFDFHGQTFYMRVGFPYGQISALSDDFTLVFLFLSIAILLLFSLLAWMIIHYLTRPIKEIIEAIRPYHLGLTDHIAKIKLGSDVKSKDEFTRLAETINSLSERIEDQISTVTKERNEKEAILESLGEGVIAVDHDLKIEYINQMAKTLLGVDENLVAGKNFRLTTQPLCEALLRKAQKTGQAATGLLKPEIRPQRTLDAIAVAREKEDGAILVLQDKTSLHKVIELGRDFVANASHELKTPITIIRGFAETLHDHPELSREVSTEITEKIVRNCGRMDTLVKNLLALAAVDEKLPRSRLTECDLLELIEECRQTTVTVHPTAHIAIAPQGKGPFYHMIDSDLFMQAILNLLDNAVKYSEAPAQVTVEVERQQETMEIRVTDKGVGIPQEAADKIFERFFAVDKVHSRSLGGSGLGLSIVGRIIEKHEGQIAVTSKLGVGTTFTISLPIKSDDSY